MLCVCGPETILKLRWMSRMKLEICFMLETILTLINPFVLELNAWNNLKVVEIEMAVMYFMLLGAVCDFDF
jgi:hypothetical protein